MATGHKFSKIPGQKSRKNKSVTLFQQKTSCLFTSFCGIPFDENLSFLDEAVQFFKVPVSTSFLYEHWCWLAISSDWEKSFEGKLESLHGIDTPFRALEGHGEQKNSASSSSLMHQCSISFNSCSALQSSQTRLTFMFTLKNLSISVRYSKAWDPQLLRYKNSMSMFSHLNKARSMTSSIHR